VGIGGLVLSMGYSLAMAKRPSETKRIAAVDAVLVAMEAHVGLTGTLELHDPLYAWRDSGAAADLAALQVAYTTHSQHPILSELEGRLGPWLGSGADPAARSLGATLEAHGHPIPSGADPLEQVEKVLSRRDEVEGLLKGRIKDLEQAVAQRGRLADVLAGVSALAVVIAMLGWLAATGVLPVPWLPPPTPPEDMDNGAP
jgi:hypothetical protein